MTAYSRGADFERRVKAALERYGWQVFRSAGSHSVADLIALQADHDPVLIQAKANPASIRPIDRSTLLNLAIVVGGVPIIAYRQQIGAKLRYRRLTGEGAHQYDEWHPASCGQCR